MTRIIEVRKRKTFIHTLDKVEIFDVLRQRFPADEENIVRVVNILQALLLYCLCPGLAASDSSDDLDDEEGEEDDGDDDQQADVEEVGLNKVLCCWSLLFLSVEREGRTGLHLLYLDSFHIQESLTVHRQDRHL